jgi:hypothetical protein
MSEEIEQKIKKCNDSLKRMRHRKTNLQKQLAEVQLHEQCEYSFALLQEDEELRKDNAKLKEQIFKILKKIVKMA